MKNAWKLLAAMCALVIGVYAYMAQSGVLEMRCSASADTYYNLLVQGFRAGQLSLKKEAPAELARLADPYDPEANSHSRLLDVSYYKGKLYLYFGVTPALILFWPYVALTGDYLFHRQAVAIFCVIGFLASVGLLNALWRRYFAEVSAGVVAACALALGLATGVPVLLSRCDVYEVAISCGYMLTMLSLAGIWCALHEPERSGRWLAAASLAYGLAVGARPNLLFGAVILLVPVVQAWRERRQVWVPLMAATVPITVIGLGLMLYNDLRFDNPFDFGWQYMLAGERQVARESFRLQNLWFNFRAYFLEPARWSARSPFVHTAVMPTPPAGYAQVGKVFGVLTNIPLVWLALAVPLAWRNRPKQAASTLRWFVTATALLFAVCAITLGLFESANFRYEVDFLPALLSLAVVGVLGLERELADRPIWRRAARWSGGVLAGFSVAFNLFASVAYYAEAQNNLGYQLFEAGKFSEAVGHYQQALRINPDYPDAHCNMGISLDRLGRRKEAIHQYEQALQINPDIAEARYDLGSVLGQEGKVPEAIEQFEQALRIKPNYAEAHCNLGVILMRVGRLPDAIYQYEQALRIRPDYAEARNNLGVALLQAGRVPEAIEQYEQVLRINPDIAEAHYNLGVGLEQEGKVPEAIEQLEQALRIRPNYVEAHYKLGVILMQAGRVQEAIEQYQQVVWIRPDAAEAHYNLGVALERAGKTGAAISQYEQALKINPNFAAARNALTRLQPGR